MECMIQLNPETADALAALVELNFDSARGFKLAAEHVKSPVAAHTFRVYADSRKDMAHELQSLLAASGHEAPAGGSVAAAAERWWSSLRSGITRDEERAILADAERDEAGIRERYERAMNTTRGQQPVHDVLVRQFGNVRRIHNRIRALCDAH